MRRTWKAAALALPIALAAAGGAEAASCKTKFLRGVWVGHATTEVDLYCMLQFKENGVTAVTSCFNPKTLKSVATLDGSLKVTGDCKVTGAFDLLLAATGKTSPATFTGKMRPDEGVMTGDFVIFGEGEAYRFVQQWN